MKRLVLGFIALLVAFTATAVGQTDLFGDPPSLIIVEQRLAYSLLPPRSITVTIPSVTLQFDLRTDLGWGDREWSQWGLSVPIYDSPGWKGSNLACSCKSWTGLRDWQFKPLTYWPHAKQYLISNPDPRAWQTFALCLDVPNLTWGTSSGYSLSLTTLADFASFRAGDGIPLAASKKHAIVPAPAIETGPMNAQGGTVRSPYVVEITFSQVQLEWFRWNGEDRLRAGNVVLMPYLGNTWHKTNLNAIYLAGGRLLVDLQAGTVHYVETDSNGVETLFLTPLTVTIDDGSAYFIPFEPSLWY